MHRSVPLPSCAFSGDGGAGYCGVLRNRSGCPDGQNRQDGCLRGGLRLRDGCLRGGLRLRDGCLRGGCRQDVQNQRDGCLRDVLHLQDGRNRSCLRDGHYNRRCNSDPKDFE